jgi:hypothetical protein
MNILYIFVEIIKKSTTMKNLIFLLLVLFITSCKTNEILFVVNVGNEDVMDTKKVVCLIYSPGDTALVYPDEYYKFVYDESPNDTMLSSFDTLVYVNWYRDYCP